MVFTSQVQSHRKVVSHALECCQVMRQYREEATLFVRNLIRRIFLLLGLAIVSRVKVGPYQRPTQFCTWTKLKQNKTRFSGCLEDGRRKVCFQTNHSLHFLNWRDRNNVPTIFLWCTTTSGLVCRDCTKIGNMTPLSVNNYSSAERMLWIQHNNQRICFFFMNPFKIDYVKIFQIK